LRDQIKRLSREERKKKWVATIIKVEGRKERKKERRNEMLVTF
jgi:hypothetical protein